MTIEIHAGAVSQSRAEAQSGLRRVLTSAAIGQFVEWYDFVVYAYSAAIIAKLFFPNTIQPPRCWRRSRFTPSDS